jgi:6-phosphogluconolactonase
MKTVTGKKPKIEVLSDPETLARRTVGVFVEDAQKAIRNNGCFFAALSGGHTPRRFFELLGELPESQALPWDKVHLFWVDERCVQPDSEQSNYKLASDTFLPKVAIPPQNIHRVQTEQSDCKAVAKNYERTIREVLKLQDNQFPAFDLIVLGMGGDGHTGSLFPNSYAPFDTDDLACVVYELDDKLSRITMTHPVLKAALHVVVLVSGEEKADILKNVLTREQDEVRYPIHVLWPILDRITWLVDSDAASLL